KHNVFSTLEKLLTVLSTVAALVCHINAPLTRLSAINLLTTVIPFDFQGHPFSAPLSMATIRLILFLVLVISRISRYTKVVRDRMIAVIIFAFFTVFFWMSCEQGATSLIIFARDTVDRTLTGASATVFNIVNTLLTVVPLMI